MRAGALVGCKIKQVEKFVYLGSLITENEKCDNENKRRIALAKDTFQKYVVDVSIPYGVNEVDKPEELIPFLNGVVVRSDRKTSAFHPDAWRSYPDPHQLLGAICYKLGLEPWSYANRRAEVESFRVLGFNEKEPFQDLSVGKKKKKSKDDEALEEETGGTGGSGGGGGAFPF